MNFSVIIPTRNRPQLLIKTLNSIEKAAKAYKDKVEVLCVDNNSEKKTKDLVFSYKSQNFIYFALEEKKIGPTFARNKGILNAKYKYLVFVDDDCEIKKNHFIKYNKAWKKYNYARAIGGRISIKKESGNFSKKEKALLNKHGWCYGSLDYKKTLKLKYGQLLFGSNMSIKLGKNIKNYLFDKNLGREIYNNQVLYAEDYEICNRFILNGEIVVFDKNISINNIVTTNRFSEKYLFNRYWKLGIERYISDKLLEKIGGRTYKNELFNAISIKNIILGRSGILQIFKTKYDFLTLLSYFSSGKSFIK